MSRQYTKHGLRHHPLYDTWKEIRKRCGSPSYKEYHYYGGRGIKMCEAWMLDASKFIDYVTKLPNYNENGYTLDRIDNDGNYEPGNMRWATKQEQVLNRRIQSNNKTGYIGVCFTQGKFKSTIKIKGKSIHLGTYETPEEAVGARNLYIIERKLNYPIQ